VLLLFATRISLLAISIRRSPWAKQTTTCAWMSFWTSPESSIPSATLWSRQLHHNGARPRTAKQAAARECHGRRMPLPQAAPAFAVLTLVFVFFIRYPIHDMMLLPCQGTRPCTSTLVEREERGGGHHGIGGGFCLILLQRFAECNIHYWNFRIHRVHGSLPRAKPQALGKLRYAESSTWQQWVHGN
jgi:hypothetical protein